MKNNILIWIFKLTCSSLFILSAFSKLYPSPSLGIQIFEENQLFPLGFGEFTGMVFSRLLIALELALGVGFLLPFSKNFITYPLSFLLLIIFNTHLGILIFSGEGNQGNCGCFGELIHMTPMQAWIKNWIALLIIAVLFTKRNKNEIKLLWIIPFLASTIQLILVYLSPPHINTTSTSHEDTPYPFQLLVDSSIYVQLDSSILVKYYFGLDTNKNFLLDSSEIHRDFDFERNVKKPKLRIEKKEAPLPTKSPFSNYYPKIDEGRKIICIFSPDCPHCKEVAKKISAFSTKKLRDVQIHFLFKEPQNSNQIDDFFKYCGKTYPFQQIPRTDFLKFIGKSLNLESPPGIFFLWNGNLLETFTDKDGTPPIEDWLKKHTY
jgi:hypothetical protein